MLNSGELLKFLQDRLGNTLLDLYCLKEDEHASKELLAKVLRGTERNPFRYLLLYEAFNLGITETREPLPPPQKPPVKRPNWNPPFWRMALNKEKHRSTYLRLIEENPKATRSQIAAMDIAAYAWLRKYDRAWFDEHHSKVPIGKKTQYATLEERDAECVALIEKALALVKLEKGVPQQITASYLGSLLGPKVGKRLGRNSHLPRSKALIEAHRDANEVAFYLRRIEWGVAHVTARIGYRNFCKLAALRPKVSQNPEIDQLAREAHQKTQEKYLKVSKPKEETD